MGYVEGGQGMCAHCRNTRMLLQITACLASVFDAVSSKQHPGRGGQGTRRIPHRGSAVSRKEVLATHGKSRDGIVLNREVMCGEIGL